MSLLADLFTDIFARRDNLLSRQDPRTKLIVAMAMLCFVIFSTNPALPLVVLIACMAAAIAVGVPARFVLLRLIAPLGIASVLFVLQAILVGSTALWSTQVLGWKIAVYQEGLFKGFLLASRVLGAVSVMLLLSTVTPAHRLFLGMRALGVSRSWVEIALLMYRYIFTLLELTMDLTAAQRIRLGYSSLRRGLPAAGVVAGTVILRAVDQSVRTEEAMRIRGYTGEIPLGELPPLTRRDGWIMAAAGCVMTALFLAFGRR